MEEVVRAEGAVPAAIRVFDGKLVLGLSAAQIAFFADSEDLVKVNSADLAAVLASGRPGAATVAGTMFIAARAGIRILATGGIGGVHHGAEQSFDISADLMELARTPVAVVCSGAKRFLTLISTYSKTVEHLRDEWGVAQAVGDPVTGPLVA